jgi:hypothetical protein
MRRLDVAYALVAAALLGPATAFAATPRSGPLGTLMSPVLDLAGALWPDGRAEALPNSRHVARDRGWQDVELVLDDHGVGLFVEVSGRAQFESAAIYFADGEDTALDLRGATRGGGLYLLSAFDGDRAVDRVTLRLRARSADAHVGLRLGR